MMPKIQRRDFIQWFLLNGALLATPLGSHLVYSAMPKSGRRSISSNAHAFACRTEMRQNIKKLLVVFQRGACDGLSVLPPIDDDSYYRVRPSIAIAKTAALPLSPPFGLHPSLGALLPAWKERDLVFIHQFGSPDITRSHFDAQDYMETGTPGVKATTDGFLSRALMTRHDPAKNPFRAVAIQPTLPRMLQGELGAISMRSLKDFQMGANPRGGIMSFESLYDQAVDEVFQGVGQEAFQSIHQIADKTGGISLQGFASTPASQRLHELATLFCADLGVEVALTECTGWDTHAGQGNAEGALSRRLKDLGDGLAAFRQAMIEHKLWDDMLVIVMTEFGRTARENGTRGTDHGHGSVAMAMGGPLRARQKGGRVAHAWRGLQPDALYEGRDVPVIHDYRDVMTEALLLQLGVQAAALGDIFPDHSPKLWRLFN